VGQIVCLVLVDPHTHVFASFEQFYSRGVGFVSRVLGDVTDFISRDDTDDFAASDVVTLTEFNPPFERC
jgi:hypothetical protein